MRGLSFSTRRSRTGPSTRLVGSSCTRHRFFSTQPDLNYDNPRVVEAIRDIMQFWLDMGVDGFRCDAAPYLIEREGTSCENLA